VNFLQSLQSIDSLRQSTAEVVAFLHQFIQLLDLKTFNIFIVSKQLNMQEDYID